MKAQYGAPPGLPAASALGWRALGPLRGSSGSLPFALHPGAVLVVAPASCSLPLQLAKAKAKVKVRARAMARTVVRGSDEGSGSLLAGALEGFGDSVDDSDVAVVEHLSAKLQVEWQNVVFVIIANLELDKSVVGNCAFEEAAHARRL